METYALVLVSILYCGFVYCNEINNVTWDKIQLQNDRIFPLPDNTFTGMRSSRECIVECMSKTPQLASVTYALSKTCRCHVTNHEFETTNYTPESGTKFYRLLNPVPQALTVTDYSGGGTPCYEIYNSGITVSGVYRIEPVSGTVFDVYCNMTDGGWTYIQQRFDNTESFDRTYQEYTDGFGSIGSEFWLGLENIHLLTTSPRLVQFDMITVEGQWLTVKFSGFSLTDSSSFYKLSVSAFVSGNCYTSGLSFLYGNDKEFYARDRDNSNNCANLRSFGWWFNYCTYISINGAYGVLSSYSGFVIYCGGYRNLVSSVMKIQ